MLRSLAKTTFESRPSKAHWSYVEERQILPTWNLWDLAEEFAKGVCHQNMLVFTKMCDYPDVSMAALPTLCTFSEHRLASTSWWWWGGTPLSSLWWMHRAITIAIAWHGMFFFIQIKRFVYLKISADLHVWKLVDDLLYPVWMRMKSLCFAHKSMRQILFGA